MSRQDRYSENQMGELPDILRSRSIETPIETRDKLYELALGLIRTVFPPQKGIRLVGVALSNFELPNVCAEAELPFRGNLDLRQPLLLAGRTTQDNHN